MFPLASEPKGLARWQVANYRNRGMKSSFSTNISLKESIAGRSKMKKKLGPESKMVSTIFIGRWTARILSSLKERPHRHGELRRHLGSVSQRMLTRTLRNLESTGLISRHVTRSKSIAVEYSLTKLGRTFIAPLTGICRWANNNHKELSAVVWLLETNQKRE